MTDSLLLRNVRVDDRLVDVWVSDGVIAEVGHTLARQGDVEAIDGGGGALIPGLHDHHIHLYAAAAARRSVPVGPGAVRDDGGLVRALREADASLPPGTWIRAVGYHESVAGALDRAFLDRIVPARPVRVQHRTGAMWVLNSAGLEALGTADVPAGAGRDPSGELNGRLHRADEWLRDHLPSDIGADLADLGAALARVGITGVTDATPFRRAEDLDSLARAVAAGALPQTIVVTGGVEMAGAAAPPGLQRGPVKVLLDEHDLPSLDDLAGAFRAAHAQDRPVAVHCVTRASLVLALAAWAEAGAGEGDRIEHGSVIPPELATAIADLGLTVVTQPAFVAERGDQYLADVEADDLHHLYPCGSLLAAGVPVAGSSDTPYTDPDPWAAMRAAVKRRTRSGRVLGEHEALRPSRALALYLGTADRPGGPVRTVAPGRPADLCLLDGPVPSTAEDFALARVALTVIAGRVVYRK